jgi:hypothetical protein
VTAVDHHRLGVGDPRLIIDPDRHPYVGQRADPARPPARGRLIRDQPNVAAALLGPDQRLDDARPGRQAIGTDQDFMFSIVDRADREGGTVFLGGEADRDRRSGTLTSEPPNALSGSAFPQWRSW